MKKIIALMSVAMMLTACGSDEPNNGGNENPEVEPIVRPLDFPVPDGEAPEEPVFEPTSDADFSEGIKTFSINYFEATCKTEIDDNIVVSPFSAYYALAMLANGADGNTRNEIVKAFGFENIAMSDLNGHLAQLTAKLREVDNMTTIEFANSIWMMSSFPVYQSYKSVLSQYYDAAPHMISPSTFQEDLNAWCAEKTNNMIREFPMDGIPQVAMFNALYLKARWYQCFSTHLTKPGEFNNADGTTSEVDFMNSPEMLAAYKESDQATFIELMMGMTYSFNIAIPKSVNDIDKVAPSGNISDNDLYYKTYNVSLPKFNIKNHYDITAELKKLGINDAFGNESNFSRISDIDLFVNQALQGNNFSIDEKGVEAASVTGFGMETSNLNDKPYTPETIVIDRPFLFSITERTTGAILFMGKVTKL